MLKLFPWLWLVFSCTSFTPVPIEPEPVEPGVYELGVVLVGDTGTGEEGQYQVAHGIKTYCTMVRCDFGLLLGDNIYPAGVQDKDDAQFAEKFELPYKDLSFAFYAVLGNHDHMGSWQAEVEHRSPHWLMPARWYVIGDNYLFDAFALDTSTGAFQTARWPEQRDWLKEMLGESQARWKLVFGHYPVFSYGMHGDDAELKKYLKPTLEEFKVDFYVAGHDHNRQLFERDGVNYLVSGAGAKTRGLKPCGCDFAATNLGFAHLLLSKEKALLRFVNAQGQVEFEKVFLK